MPLQQHKAPNPIKIGGNTFHLVSLMFCVVGLLSKITLTLHRITK